MQLNGLSNLSEQMQYTYPRRKFLFGNDNRRQNQVVNILKDELTKTMFARKQFETE